jgi:EpsI family protein
MATVAAADAKIVPLWALIALLTGTSLLFAPEAHELVTLWLTRHQSAHGFLVVAAIPALLWMRRTDVRFGGNRWGGVFLVLMLAPIFALAKAASVSIVYWAVLPILVGGTVWVAFGAVAARAVAFPLGFFVFAIPLLEKLAPFFQSLTAVATAVLLRAAGIGAEASGVVVTVPEGAFRVTETCAGMHVMVAALATVTAYSYIERLRRREAAILIISAIGVAIVANWTRVLTVVYVGHVTAMHSPLIGNHFLLGWAVFAVLMIPLMFFARRLAERSGMPPPSEVAPPLSVRQAGGRVAIALGALAAAPAWGWVTSHAARAERVPTIAMPSLAAWDGPMASSRRWTPFFPGAAAQALASYRAGADVVDAFVVFYSVQGANGKIVGGASSVGGEDQWFGVENRTLATPAVTELVLVNEPGERRVVWTWYEVRGRRYLSPWAVKVQQGLQAFGAPARYGLIALSATCGVDCDGGREVLARAYSAGLAHLSADTDTVRR